MRKLQSYTSIVIITIGSFLFPNNPLFAQTGNFENTVRKVITAFKQKDSLSLDSLAHKEIGVYVLFRRGVMDEFKHSSSIDFNNPIPEYLPYPECETNNNIQYEPLPTINCGTLEWSKKGLFCDTTYIDSLLSKTVIAQNKWNNKKYSISLIDKIKQIQQKSRKVILIDKSGSGLMFNLTLINNKWHLTIIDRVTNDCSA